MIESNNYKDLVVAEMDEGYYSLSLKTYAMLYYKGTRSLYFKNSFKNTKFRYKETKCLVKADSDNVLMLYNYERLCEENSKFRGSFRF